MKRALGAAALVSGAAIALMGLAAPAEAAGSVILPADCALTSTAVYTNVTYNVTCSGRPAGEQWQVVLWCNPRGADGGDSFHYGNIVTGNGTSSGGCAILNRFGYTDVSFSNSNLQPPGHQP